MSLELVDYAATEIMGLELKGRMYFPKNWSDDMAEDEMKLDSVIQRAEKENDNFPGYFRPDQHYKHLKLLKDAIKDEVDIELTKISIKQGCECVVTCKKDKSKFAKAKHPVWTATNILTLAVIVGYYKTYVAKTTN